MIGTTGAAPTAPLLGKRRVLIVDDDEHVLDGLRRLLRRRVRGPELAFASSGSQALELLAAAPVDIVVSDMRMPVMDGATLLAQVRARAPGAARVVLSGQTSADAALRAAAVAHRFLDKPVAPETLTATIGELLDNVGTLPDGTARERLGALAALPSPGERCVRFRQALSADADPDALASACGGDLGIASKAVQLVSTAFFGPVGEVGSLREAFARLGTSNLRSLGAHGVFPTVAAPELEQLGHTLARHALRVARLAGEIAGTRASGTLQLACLLHDVGVLAAIDDCAATATATADHARSGILGDYLLALWGIPQEVRATIHAARHAGEIDGAKPRPAGASASALALADALDADSCPLPGHGERRQGVDPGALGRWRERSRRLSEELP